MNYKTLVGSLAFLCLAASVQAQAIPDAPFQQEYHEAYPMPTAGANDVKALAFDGAERLWAATAEGVRYLEGGAWKTPEGGTQIGTTYALTRDASGDLWAGTWNGIYKVTPKGVVSGGLKGALINAIDGGDPLFAGGPHGIWKQVHGKWEAVGGSWHKMVHAVHVAPTNQMWVGTGSGLYLQSLTSPAETRVFSRPDVLLSSNVSSLTPLADGTLCIGTTGGLDFYKGAKRIRSLTAKDGMPSYRVRSVTQDAERRLWAATEMGVVRYDAGRWTLRHSRRWLLSDDTRSVAIGRDGTAWVATAAGVDAIRRRKMTLADKADYYLQMIRARHIRPPGLVGPAVLVTPGDLSKSFIEDDDNDGEHTAMYLAMESMRYAVTKDPTARDNAKVAFHALMELQRATGTDHFIARSILPVSTPPRHEVDQTITPERAAAMYLDNPREKPIEKRWLPTKDGKWFWKRDASSDEVDGHVFGYAVYYDLAATEEEKRLVADQVDRIIGGIVAHGYVLQDIDGKGTQWANWSPESLNRDKTWREERFGNSTEMLSYLGVAYHVTQKQKYLDAVKYLVEKHGYAKNMASMSYVTPSEYTHINDELLVMVFHNLFTNSATPALEKSALTALRSWHKTCRRDGIPFYDFIFNRFSGQQVPLDRAMETLRDWPLDHIEWTVDSSRRADVQWDRTPGAPANFLTRILPRSEIGLCMWDQEPYFATMGRNGEREDRPNDWLLAYWMGRYYGIIGSPE